MCQWSLAVSAATLRISHQDDPVLHIAAGVRNELWRGPPRLCQAPGQNNLQDSNLKLCAQHYLEAISLAHRFPSQLSIQGRAWPGRMVPRESWRQRRSFQARPQLKKTGKGRTWLTPIVAHLQIRQILHTLRPASKRPSQRLLPS